MGVVVTWKQVMRRTQRCWSLVLEGDDLPRRRGHGRVGVFQLLAARQTADGRRVHDPGDRARDVGGLRAGSVSRATRVFVLSRDGGLPRAPEGCGRPSGPRAAFGAVAGAAQRPKHSVFATLGGYGRRVLGRRDTQKGNRDDRRDHWRWCV